MMNLLYIVNFHAPMGGLHENVYASAVYMKKQGCTVHVVLKPGRLEQRMKAEGIHTITTDFSDADQALESIEYVDVAFDLVHFHPGPSKYPALKYAEKYSVPLIETYHGIWLDGLEDHIDQLDAIVTVSEGIKNHLQSRIDAHYEKYYVMPNGYDSSLFDQPKYHDRDSEEITVGFVTRLDKDKQFIMDILLLAVNHIKTRSDIKINIHMIGDGTHRDEFMELCQNMLEDTDHTIQFKGWLVDEELKNAYLDCDIIIAPGRSAIEGMACGKPVVCSLVEGSLELLGDSSNLQGFGAGRGGEMSEKIRYLMENAEIRDQVGKANLERISSEYSLPSVMERYHGFYHSLTSFNRQK